MSKYFPDWRQEREKLLEIYDYRYLIKRLPDIDDTNMYVPDEQDPHRRSRSYCKISNVYFRNSRLAMHDDNLLTNHYKLLIKYKDKELADVKDFEPLLTEILENMPIISLHLASQILHFINHDLPICSKPVREGLNVSWFQPTNIKDACDLYKRLNEKINAFRISSEGQDIIKDFKDSFGNDEHILNYISDNKIIDFYFWLPTLDKE